MTDGTPPHVSVFADEVVRFLVPEPGQRLIVDATLGAGGHAALLLGAMGPAGRLLGIDRDPDALAIAAERLAPFGERAHLVRGNFEDVGEIVKTAGSGPVDGVLYDFGVSSMMFDRAERGFSYQHDAPLDMRMDPSLPLSAADVLNTYEEAELTRIIKTYGEERWAARIAQFIVAARRRAPIATTGELVDVIRAAIPSAARRVGPHPARRTFQALRIEVNRELEAIETSLPQAAAALSDRGRLVALSYHSLEDRIVKRFFKAESTGETPRLRVLTKRPLRPTEEEVERNPRASAARLRAAERWTPRPRFTGPSGSAA